MQDFAFGNDRSRSGKNLQYVQVTIGNHQGKRFRKEEITHQNGRLISPERIGRSKAAAKIGVIHHIVMQQGGGVNKFYHTRQRDMPIAVIAAHFCRKEQERRPNSLATARKNIFADFANQRDI